MLWNENNILNGKLSYEEITNDYELTYLIEDSDFSFMQSQINKDYDYHIGGAFDLQWFRFFISTKPEITLGLLGICPLANIHPEDLDEDDDAESVMYIACVEVSKKAKQELGIIDRQNQLKSKGITYEGVLSNIVKFIHYKYPECYEIQLSTESASPKLRDAYIKCGFKAYDTTSWGGYKMKKPLSLQESVNLNTQAASTNDLTSKADDFLSPEVMKYKILKKIQSRNANGDGLTKEPNFDTFCGLDIPKGRKQSDFIKQFLSDEGLCKIKSVYTYYYQSETDSKKKKSCWYYLEKDGIDNNLILWVDWSNTSHDNFEAINWDELPEELQKDVYNLVFNIKNMNESVNTGIQQANDEDLQRASNNPMEIVPFDVAIEELNLPVVKKHFYNNGGDAAWVMICPRTEVQSGGKEMPGHWMFHIQVGTIPESDECYISSVKFDLPIYTFDIPSREDDNEWLSRHYSDKGFSSSRYSNNELHLFFEGLDTGMKLTYKSLSNLKLIQESVKRIAEIQQTTNDNNPIEAIYQSGLGQYLTKESKSDWNFTVGSKQWGGYTDWEMSYPDSKRDEMHFPLNESVNVGIRQANQSELTDKADKITFEQQFNELVDKRIKLEKKCFGVHISLNDTIDFDWNGIKLKFGGVFWTPNDVANGRLDTTLWWKSDNGGQLQCTHKPSYQRQFGFPVGFNELPQEVKDEFYEKVVTGVLPINESVNIGIQQASVEDTTHQSDLLATGVFNDNEEFVNAIADAYEESRFDRTIQKRLEMLGLTKPGDKFAYSKNNTVLRDCVESIFDNGELEQLDEPDTNQVAGFAVGCSGINGRHILYLLVIPDKTKPICELGLYVDSRDFGGYDEENPYALGITVPKSMAGIHQIIYYIPLMYQTLRKEKYGTRLKAKFASIRREDMDESDEYYAMQEAPTDLFFYIIDAHLSEIFKGNINESVNVGIQKAELEDPDVLDDDTMREMLVKHLSGSKIERKFDFFYETNLTLPKKLMDEFENKIQTEMNNAEIIYKGKMFDVNDKLVVSVVLAEQDSYTFATSGKGLHPIKNNIVLQFKFFSDNLFDSTNNTNYTDSLDFNCQWIEIPLMSIKREIFNLIMSKNESVNIGIQKASGKQISNAADDQFLIPEKTMKLKLEDVIEITDCTVYSHFSSNLYNLANDGTYEDDEFPCYIYDSVRLKYDDEGNEIEHTDEYYEEHGFEVDLQIGCYFIDKETMVNDAYPDNSPEYIKHPWVVEDELHQKTFENVDFNKVLKEAINNYYKYTPIEII